jgi:hypothetical protein
VPSPDGIRIPKYQVPFINAQNGGSTTLRNVPDSVGDADTDNFSCFGGHCYTSSGGTSYAAPIWAGFIALANQYAAVAGKPPLTISESGAVPDGGHGIRSRDRVRIAERPGVHPRSTGPPIGPEQF